MAKYILIILLIPITSLSQAQENQERFASITDVNFLNLERFEQDLRLFNPLFFTSFYTSAFTIGIDENSQITRVNKVVFNFSPYFERDKNFFREIKNMVSFNLGFPGKASVQARKSSNRNTTRETNENLNFSLGTTDNGYGLKLTL